MSKNSPSDRARRRAWQEGQVQRKRDAAARVPLPPELAAALKDGRQRAELGRRAAAWVAGYRRRYGCGPTWSELADELHPDCDQMCGDADDDPYAVVSGHTHQLVARLRNTGWLSASRQPRSLDIGPRLATKRTQLEQTYRTRETAQTAGTDPANPIDQHAP